MTFLATDQYKGLTLDIEGFPDDSRDDFHTLVQELIQRSSQPRGLKLYVAVPVNEQGSTIPASRRSPTA